MPTVLYLIRHGQSEGNVDKKIYYTKKDHEIELTDLGKEQASQVGAALNKQLILANVDVFVSPYKRTRQTWENIKAELTMTKDLISIEDVLLREQEHCDFKNEKNMKRIREDREEFSPFYYRYKNAESQADVYLRAQTFINNLRISRLEDKLYNDVVIITHEVVIRMILAILEKTKVEDMNVSIANCELIRRLL